MNWRPSPAFARFTALTAVLTYLAIVMGGVVRVTGSGLGCGDKDQWPFCHGQLLPPLEQTALIEFGHRWIASLATIAVVFLAGWVWLRYRHVRALLLGTNLVVLFFFLQIALGAVTVKLNLPSGVVLIHLANALLLLGALVWIATLTAMAGSHARARPAQAALKLGVIAVGATYLLTLSGALVVDQGAGFACAGWPLCGNGFQLSSAQLADINLLHRIVAGLVVLLLGYSTMKLRRVRRDDRALRRATVAVNLLIVAQVAAGALVVELRLPPAIRAVHLALASALWACVVLTAVISRGDVVGEAIGDALLDRPRPARAGAS